MNIVYIGSSSSLSLLPLQALLESEHHVCLIIANADAHASAPQLPVVDAARESLASLALKSGAPLVRVGSNWRDCAKRIRDCSADIIFVSCFARRLPDEICAMAKQACINLHPSLLPAYRGPDPVFWQFRHGETDFGVSLHLVSPELDRGAILVRKSVSMPDGIPYSAACHRLAEKGTAALLELLSNMNAPAFLPEPQDETQADYQSFPEDRDFILNQDWPARRLYNFICAMRERTRYFPCHINGHCYSLTAAYSYQTARKKKLAIAGSRITVPCADGSVEAEFLL